jgi:hypothetical protein
VTLDGERIEADVVVGADGANGITARSLGLPAHEHGSRSRQCAYGDVSRERYAGRAVVELDVVPAATPGSFRRATTSTSASAAGQSEGPRLRERLRELCGASASTRPRCTTRVDTAADAGRRAPAGPRTRAARRRRRRARRPALGDGMYEAFVSGRLAAETILAGGGLEPYAERFAATFAPLEPFRGARSSPSSASRASRSGSRRRTSRGGCSRRSCAATRQPRTHAVCEAPAAGAAGTRRLKTTDLAADVQPVERMRSCGVPWRKARATST